MIRQNAALTVFLVGLVAIVGIMFALVVLGPPVSTITYDDDPGRTLLTPSP